jgi:Leucine-rich repeat (LRR) protein
MDQSLLRVLKVQRLPGRLATKVLAASPADLDRQLSILPPSMHQLAVHAAFPSIRCHHSLTLSWNYHLEKSSTTLYAVLEAATTAPNFLKKFDLSYRPKQNDTRLMQLIAAACMTASDVNFMIDCDNLREVPWRQPGALLHEALSHNTSLTCLKLSFGDAPSYCISFDYLLDGLTGLQTLSLAKYQPRGDASCICPLPVPICIVDQLSLTHLCLGPGFHLLDLPQIIHRMASLRFFGLTCDPLVQLQDLPDLSPLTALQTLKLRSFQKLKALPTLARLTALQTLDVSFCLRLKHLPSLATLAALQTLKLFAMSRLVDLPPLDTLTALQTLDLGWCSQLQGIPSLATLTALQTLKIKHCGFVQQIPSVDALTALQTLELRGSRLVVEMPPLATLTALQTIILDDCPQGLQSTFQHTLPSTDVQMKRSRQIDLELLQPW